MKPKTIKFLIVFILFLWGFDQLQRYIDQSLRIDKDSSEYYFKYCVSEIKTKTDFGHSYKCYKDMSSKYLQYGDEKYNLQNLKYMEYYDKNGMLDARYIFEEGKLSKIYDFKIPSVGESMLEYEVLYIQKKDNRYTGYVTKFDPKIQNVLFTKKMYVDFKDGEVTKYLKYE